MLSLNTVKNHKELRNALISLSTLTKHDFKAGRYLNPLKDFDLYVHRHVDRFNILAKEVYQLELSNVGDKPLYCLNVYPVEYGYVSKEMSCTISHLTLKEFKQAVKKYLGK